MKEGTDDFTYVGSIVGTEGECCGYVATVVVGNDCRPSQHIVTEVGSYVDVLSLCDEALMSPPSRRFSYITTRYIN